jgi:tryptophan-rich sensory protein
MKINWKKLLISLGIPVGVGAVAALLTGGGMGEYGMMNQPPLSPPGWLFPVVWTILYTLMGISAYLIKTSDASAEAKSDTLMIYNYQLIVNFLWSIFFFNFEWRLFSFFWILLLWVLIILMIRQFDKISQTAAYLNLPYLLWVTFAAYLNFGIWWLNR